MPNLAAISQRLHNVVQTQNNPITTRLFERLEKQQLKGQLSSDFITKCQQEFGLSAIELALHCVPLSACYAYVPVSAFYVGAVAIGQSGTFYFGANQEYSAVAIQQTVHAEQSAISHAWLAGETAITDMVVNTTPCGHCRQFMNELNTAENLHIHLPHSQNNLLHSYLPDSFGPKNLAIEKVLFDPQNHTVTLRGDLLSQTAIQQAAQSYAPYSGAISAVAIQVGEQIIAGRYAENAAFNPSFLPLQSAINYQRLLGLSDQKVSRVVFAERKGKSSHLAITQELCRAHFGLELEVIEI